MENKITTIKVWIRTREALLKIGKMGETYNDVILRLIADANPEPVTIKKKDEEEKKETEDEMMEMIPQKDEVEEEVEEVEEETEEKLKPLLIDKLEEEKVEESEPSFIAEKKEEYCKKCGAPLEGEGCGYCEENKSSKNEGDENAETRLPWQRKPLRIKRKSERGI